MDSSETLNRSKDSWNSTEAATGQGARHQIKSDNEWSSSSDRQVKHSNEKEPESGILARVNGGRKLIKNKTKQKAAFVYTPFKRAFPKFHTGNKRKKTGSKY